MYVTCMVQFNLHPAVVIPPKKTDKLSDLHICPPSPIRHNFTKKTNPLNLNQQKNVFPCFHHLSGNGIPTVTIGSSKLFLGKVKSLENSSTVYNSFRIHTYHISHCILRPQKIMDESTCVYIYIYY